MLSEKQARLGALQRQAERLQRREQVLDALSDRYSWIRLAIFVAGIVLSVLAAILLHTWWVGISGVALTILLFAVVAYIHGQIEASLARHRVLLSIRRIQIARITLHWPAMPPVSTVSSRMDHPFETDLDITGEHSLHRLLNSATTREGSTRLCDWLLNSTPDPQVIRRRQALVRELTPMVRFRDRLLLKSIFAARDVAELWEGRKLLRWLEEHRASRSLRLSLLVGCAIALLTLILLVLSQFAHVPPYWLLSLLLSLAWLYVRRKDVGDTFGDTAYLSDAFGRLGNIFTYLETYRYGRNLQVKALCALFFRERDHSPSQLLKHLSRLISAASLNRNPALFLLLNALVPYAFFIASRLEHYRSILAHHLPAWLDTWFELEALCSLATFAYLNPEYTLPEVDLDGTETSAAARTMCFEAQGLGHPLIPAERKVANDFALPRLGEMVIITGSNMSGKSTFLRALGINLCLAYAGGPVDARTLRTGLFRLMTCIRVNDSVTGGYSYFYAEVRRLKTLLTALQQQDSFPVFFLIDEIFKGTNNRERLIGSRSYLRALAGQPCLGAISTHDLDLVRLAETVPQVANYHFREEVVHGEMAFDYLLRPGPCPTTNALKIMQMEGLPVEHAN